jgi:LmbE family N-acetylglucosaminyl deacetylase
VRPGIFVDIGGVMPEKIAMLDCHVSQNAWLDASQSLSSCVSKMTELMQEVGQMSGRFAVAEGWRKHLHLGFCEADDDPLVAALGSAVHCE